MSEQIEHNGRLPDRTRAEIVPSAKRAARSTTETLRILAEYEAYPAGAPERGAVLRREGMYTSQISKWRKQRDRGVQQGLMPQRRGPKPAPRDPVSGENARLRRENARLQAQLERAEVIIDVQKNFPGCLGRRPRRPWTSRNAADRRRTRHPGRRYRGLPRARGAAQHLLSRAPGTDRSTVSTAQAGNLGAGAQCRRARPGARPPVSSALRRLYAAGDRRHLRPGAPDEGSSLCSWSTMYRILRAADEVKRRRDRVRRGAYAKPALWATRPNQLWSWDLTKLTGPTTWSCYSLYVILDVDSRYVVGWMIAERETAALAEALIAETCAKEGIAPEQLTLHADRGSAMTSKCVAYVLTDVGMTKTHSRPHVSNDNPFSDAQFKTVKDHPSCPERFGRVEDARAWARELFEWYNHDHHHSGIGLLTPATVQRG